MKQAISSKSRFLGSAGRHTRCGNVLLNYEEVRLRLPCIPSFADVGCLSLASCASQEGPPTWLLQPRPLDATAFCICHSSAVSSPAGDTAGDVLKLSNRFNASAAALRCELLAGVAAGTE